MKEKGLHEGCIEQVNRMFHRLYGRGEIETDDEGRLRLDDWEMRDDVQADVAEIWNRVSTDTLETDTDFAGYQADFLKLFGFGLPGVDYEAEVDIQVSLD